MIDSVVDEKVSATEDKEQIVSATLQDACLHECSLSCCHGHDGQIFPKLGKSNLFDGFFDRGSGIRREMGGEQVVNTDKQTRPDIWACSKSGLISRCLRYSAPCSLEIPSSSPLSGKRKSF